MEKFAANKIADFPARSNSILRKAIIDSVVLESTAEI